MDEDLPAAGYRYGADRIRQATTATIAAFGAIGALLVAGVQLSDVGELVYVSKPRLVLSLVAVVLALVGVVIILYKQARVLTSADLSLSDLVKAHSRVHNPGIARGSENRKQKKREQEAYNALRSLDGRSELFDPWPSVIELQRDLNHEIEQRRFAYTVLRQDRERGRKLLQQLDRQTMPATYAWQAILGAINYTVLNQRFADARCSLFYGSTMILVGLIMFVLATSVPKVQAPSLRYAVLQGADLSGANLAGADLTGANFTDATLLRANLVDAVLDDVVWKDAICPDGWRAGGRVPTCLGHLSPSRDE